MLLIILYFLMKQNFVFDKNSVIKLLGLAEYKNYRQVRSNKTDEKQNTHQNAIITYKQKETGVKQHREEKRRKRKPFAANEQAGCIKLSAVSPPSSEKYSRILF